MVKLKIECEVVVTNSDGDLACHASAVYYTEGGGMSRLHAVAALFAAGKALADEGEELAKSDAKWDEAAKAEERPN